MIRSLEGQGNTLALFKDTGVTYGELHTGVVAIFPGEATETCLSEWSKKLGKNGRIQAREGKRHAFKEDSREDWSSEAGSKEGELTQEGMEVLGPDQRALHSTKSCKTSKTGEHGGIKILPEEYFWFPTASGLKEGKQAEFVHFTN